MDSSLSSNSSETGCGNGHCCNKFVENTSAATAVVAPVTLSDDAMLAKELNELSVEEREKVYEDIHGVRQGEQETPDFLESCITEFDKALAKVPRTKRPALERAMFLKPSIATDTKFKLIFLRAVDYDTTEAARRMAKYFEDKAKLFGDDKIVQTITLADFNEEDMKLFLSGPYITTPGKDSVGRNIWIGNIPKFDFTNLKSQLRCCWYVIMTTLLEDESSQFRGMTNILNCPSGINFGVPLHKIVHYMMLAGEVIGAMPVKACSHFCYDNGTMEFVLSAFRGAFGQKHRLRMRAHCGSGVELQYKLMTFGINLPFLLEDNTKIGGTDEKVEAHQLYVQDRLRFEQERRQLQQQQSALETTNIASPNPNDILVGRGAPYQTYSGNIMLSDLIETKFLDRYRQAGADRFEKTVIHMDVIKALEESGGGRFIERTPTGWRVVEEKVARKKIYSSFRSNMAKHATPSTSKKAINQQSTTPVDIGMKTTQPPVTGILNDPYAATSSGKKHGFFQMAFGSLGGSAKRPRYDPTVLVQGGGSDQQQF